MVDGTMTNNVWKPLLLNQCRTIFGFEMEYHQRSHILSSQMTQRTMEEHVPWHLVIFNSVQDPDPPQGSAVDHSAGLQLFHHWGWWRLVMVGAAIATSGPRQPPRAALRSEFGRRASPALRPVHRCSAVPRDGRWLAASVGYCGS